MKKNLTLLTFIILMIFSKISFSQQLVSVFPSSGNAGETLDVTITGTGTHFTDPSTIVDFGFNQGSATILYNSITVINNNTITANINIPLSALDGDYNSKTINTTDGLLILPMSFHVNGYIAPTLTAISPNTANNGETLDVTITGNGTHFTQNGSLSLTFQMNQGSGTINVNSVSATDDTHLMANISVMNNTNTGDYSCFVSGGVDGTVYSPTIFHVNGLHPDHINSLTPHFFNAGETVNVLINSSYSDYMLSPPTLNFGFGNGVGVNTVNVLNDSLIIANVTIPANTYSGYYNYTATNSINGPAIKSGAIYVNGLTVPSSSSFTISPQSGNAGETLTVTISGTNTQFTQASPIFLNFENTQGMQIGVINVGSINVLNDNTLTVVISISSDFNSTFENVALTNGINGVNSTMTLVNGFQINGINPLNVFVMPENESTDGACDGVATIYVSGGVPPYSYVFSNGETTSIISNQCAGIYTATVSDALGNIEHVNFVISSPSGVYTTNTYSDSTLVDTLFNDYITNCDINYSTIDSIYIEDFYLLTNNDILVTWRVVYGDSSLLITDTYTLTDFAGVYSLALQLFCPNKSISHYITAYDQFYYGSAGIILINSNDLKVYPNPFNEELLIQLESDEATTVTIADITGKIVYSNDFQCEKVFINTTDLSRGNYILFVKSNTSSFTKKLIK